MVEETQDVVETTEEEQVVETTPEQDQVEEILEPTPYQNKYRRDLDDKDTDTATEQQDTEEEKEATPEERPVTAEEKAFKKRYDDLKRHYDKTLSKHKNEVTNLRTQLEQSTNKMLPPTDLNDLAEWKKKYPDVYDIIETISLTKADERAQKLEEKYQFLQEQQTEIAKEKAEVELLKRHPDFQEIRATDQFHDWAQKQDPTIQGWLYENTDNADLAARAIDLYKMDAGITTKKSKSESKDVKKEAAKAVTSTKKGNQISVTEKKIWSVDEISRLKPHEFDKHEKDIMQARREGRIKQ
tara:strand:+ start:55 stop:948 length:894 start_codon:yes stop_codon:yes gene_type:complete